MNALEFRSNLLTLKSNTKLTTLPTLCDTGKLESGLSDHAMFRQQNKVLAKLQRITLRHGYLSGWIDSDLQN